MKGYEKYLLMPFATYNDFMPRHATKTSFKKGQKFMPDGKPMGWKPPNFVPWNKGIRQWGNGLPESIKQKISEATKGKPHPSRKKEPVIKKCVRCNKPFSVYPPYKALSRRFCSYRCSNNGDNRSEETRLHIGAKSRHTNTERGHFTRVSERMKNGGAMKARLANFPPSRFQKEVFNEVISIYPDAVMEQDINTEGGVKLADIYIPSKHLIIECDGYYWHKDKQRLDAIRQYYIETLGYRVSRIPELEWRKDKNIFRYL